MNKPYAESCDQNKEPILSVIKPLFSQSRSVLEIGSGTGQHAVYFADKMPHLIWHTSDCEENHAGINQWLQESAAINTRGPLLLNVSQPAWPAVDIDAIFSANTIHIMHWDEVEAFFSGAGEILPVKGLLAIYGPFNYDHQYTSDSNAKFDQWLKSRDPLSGIKDFEHLDRLAALAALSLSVDYEMPANNRILCWRKQVQNDAG